MDHSTTGMILKNKGQTVEQANSAVLTMSTAVLKQRGGVAEEMEKLLRGWRPD